jgi:hypothetical protein
MNLLEGLTFEHFEAEETSAQTKKSWIDVFPSCQEEMRLSKTKLGLSTLKVIHSVLACQNGAVQFQTHKAGSKRKLCSTRLLCKAMGEIALDALRSLLCTQTQKNTRLVKLRRLWEGGSEMRGGRVVEKARAWLTQAA